MIYLYRFLLPVFSIFALPYYIFRMIRRGGYSHKFLYRAGLWPKLPPKGKGTSRIWIQAVSVGELSSLGKVLESLLNHSNIEVVLSGTTSTGLMLGAKKYSNRLVAHGPFPFDWLPFSKKAWKRIQPDLAILVDSELWPEHFYQAKISKVPLVIINGRLSDRTFARLSSSILKQVRSLLFPPNLSIIASSERQQARWLSLHFPKKKVCTSGNLKIDAVDFNMINPDVKSKIRRELNFSDRELVLAGISTWQGEEELLIELVQSLRLEKIDIKLLIIPRHAERRNEIKKIFRTKGITYHTRTSVEPTPQEYIAYLADTTGEVMTLLQAVDFAFMGKTLDPNDGGQNPIEPVALALPLVMGPNNQNFRETCFDLLSHNALLVGKNAAETKMHLLRLSKDESLREEMKKNCASWMQKQGTPSEFTYSYIIEKLNLD